MIIQKMKPRGNMRTFHDPTTPTFFHKGFLNLIALAYFNLGVRFSFKGGGL
jgi:hypothetical protein